MRLGCLLLIVATCLIWFGAEHGGIWLVASWLGADFLLLSLAHFLHRPGLFGKKSDGTLSWWSWPVFFPLHCWSLFLWRLAATLTREPIFHRFDDTLVLGRRLAASECPNAFDNCVDLTAEFTEPGPLRRLPGYIALPTLDGAAPDPAAVADALARLRPGVTYVHCAQGHGRTAAFALALLLRRGDVKTVEEGMERLRAVRPGVRLSRPQMKFAREWEAAMGERSDWVSSSPLNCDDSALSNENRPSGHEDLPKINPVRNRSAGLGILSGVLSIAIHAFFCWQAYLPLKQGGMVSNGTCLLIFFPHYMLDFFLPPSYPISYDKAGVLHVDYFDFWGKMIVAFPASIAYALLITGLSTALMSYRERDRSR